MEPKIGETKMLFPPNYILGKIGKSGQNFYFKRLNPLQFHTACFGKIVHLREGCASAET